MMKNIPDSIQVGPYTYQTNTDLKEFERVKKKAGYADRSLSGLCDHETQTIFIDNTQTEDMAADTLLHEVLHAIWLVTGGVAGLDDEQQEDIVLTFSTMLFDTLRRNPDLVAYLTKKED